MSETGKANGAHYKTQPGEQHHQRVTRLGLGWYAANITKYAERAPFKGQQIDDLIKVLDYTAMWLEQGFELNSEQKKKIHEVAAKLQNLPVFANSGVFKTAGYGSVMETESAGRAYVNQDRQDELKR